MLRFSLCGNDQYVPSLTAMPATITLIYIGTIQLITHKTSELMEIKKNYLMVSLLAQLFCRYPQMLIQHLPDSFRLWLNGRIPLEQDILADGDVVEVEETK